MNVLSLFDGISIAQQALTELGYEFNYYSSEIDKYAISITQFNFPNTIKLGSVVELNPPDLDYNLLVGGSPCQDLSIANNNRKGLAGNRSSLFFEYVRILNEKRPKYFVLENVNSMSNEAKQVITDTLFGIKPVMINASLVSAQNRRRLFWVGKLVGNTYAQVNIDQPEDKKILLRDVLEPKVEAKYFIKDKAYTLRTSGRGSPIDSTRNWDSYRVSTLSNSNEVEVKTDLYAGRMIGRRLDENGVRQDYDTSIPSEQVLEVNENPEKTNVLSTVAKDNIILTLPVALRNRGKGKKPEYNGTDKANSLTTVQTDSMVEVEYEIRRLTPMECERLQSLPDDYTSTGINLKGEVKSISDAQRYKACGNGFNCEVIKHILSCIGDLDA